MPFFFLHCICRQWVCKLPPHPPDCLLNDCQYILDFYLLKEYSAEDVLQFYLPCAVIFFFLGGFLGQLPLVLLKYCINSWKNSRKIYSGSPGSLFQKRSDPMPSKLHRMKLDDFWLNLLIKADAFKLVVLKSFRSKPLLLLFNSLRMDKGQKQVGLFTWLI